MPCALYLQHADCLPYTCSMQTACLQPAHWTCQVQHVGEQSFAAGCVEHCVLQILPVRRILPKAYTIWPAGRLAGLWCCKDCTANPHVPCSFVFDCVCVCACIAGEPQGSTTASYTAPRLTYPQEHEPGALQAEESESDILPFAIDGDNGPAGDARQGSADAKTGIALLFGRHCCRFLLM